MYGFITYFEYFVLGLEHIFIIIVYFTNTLMIAKSRNLYPFIMFFNDKTYVDFEHVDFMLMNRNYNIFVT